MEPGDQRSKAAAFHALHRGRGILILLNAWDAGSARILEEAGAAAVATTSAGVAHSLGYPDGERITREAMLWVVARVAAAVDLPVTADVEAGYGPAPEDAAATARAAITAGAVGLNLEDGTGDPDRPLAELTLQVEKIHAIREAAIEAGMPLFINARTDTYLAEAGAPAERLPETIRRSRAFREAGAHCVFVPRLREPAEIAELLGESPGPLNVLAGPGVPPVPDLERLGVARVSFGGASYRAALGLLRRIAAEVRASGVSPSLDDLAIPPAEANRLFGPRGRA
jgi:2-methylisocitrate lyase-like PEP mutase family enzyme